MPTRTYTGDSPDTRARDRRVHACTIYISSNYLQKDMDTWAYPNVRGYLHGTS